MDMRQRIKDLCRKHEISMNALEKELGLGIGYISKLGKTTPSTKKIQLIADYFNVSVDYLMTGKEITEQKFTAESAHIVAKIRNDKELTKALEKYFAMSEDKKKHVIDTINMLSEGK